MSTRYHVEYFVSLLNGLGIPCLGIYGKMDNTLRKQNYGKFKSKEIRILIVTDVAARGLDIPYLSCVINYDFPSTPKMFIHRNGRTARNGESGISYNLLVNEELSYMFDVLAHIGRKLEGDIMMKFGSCSHVVLNEYTDQIEYMHKHNEDFKELKLKMENGVKKYKKSRKGASKMSVSKAKSMGSIPMHPLFKEDCGDINQEKQLFLEQIKKYKPDVNTFGKTNPIRAVIKKEVVIPVKPIKLAKRVAMESKHLSAQCVAQIPTTDPKKLQEV